MMNEKVTCMACGHLYSLDEGNGRCPECGSKYYHTPEEAEAQKQNEESARRERAYVRQRAASSSEARTNLMKKILTVALVLVVIFLLMIFGSINSASNQRKIESGIKSSLKQDDYKEALYWLKKLKRDSDKYIRYKNEIWDDAVSYSEGLAEMGEYSHAIDVIREFDGNYSDAEIKAVVDKLNCSRIIDEAKDLPSLEAASRITYLMDKYGIDDSNVSPELKEFIRKCTDSVNPVNTDPITDGPSEGGSIQEPEGGAPSSVLPVEVKNLTPYIGYDQLGRDCSTQITSNTGKTFSSVFNTYGGNSGYDFDNAYEINGQFRLLTCTVFVPEIMRNSVVVGRLTVIGDGRELYYYESSGKPGDKPFDLSVDVSGVNDLEIKLQGYSGLCLDSLMLIP